MVMALMCERRQRTEQLKTEYGRSQLEQSAHGILPVKSGNSSSAANASQYFSFVTVCFNPAAADAWEEQR
jgi:hypothetical protein